MSLDQPSIIDALSDGKDGVAVSLAIIDGWDWSDEATHLLALQTKINAYFGFVLSGQIFEERPEAQGKKLRIDFLTKYPLSVKAEQFLKIASDTAQQLDIEIVHRVV